jgi:transcriptional regulator with XRE-family HTH domain|tara:strand:+ start:257 stop:505 length:249 start_codon:yes stop_codon:yes gene_type:complete
MTQREFCNKTGISTGHLSRVLTGNAIPSGAMLVSIAKEGFDVNLILCGVSHSEILNERESEIEKLKLIIEELRSIINFNLKK